MKFQEAELTIEGLSASASKRFGCHRQLRYATVGPWSAFGDRFRGL